VSCKYHAPSSTYRGLHYSPSAAARQQSTPHVVKLVRMVNAGPSGTAWNGSRRRNNERSVPRGHAPFGSRGPNVRPAGLLPPSRPAEVAERSVEFQFGEVTLVDPVGGCGLGALRQSRAIP
jgi:hypothetical protein